MRIILLTLLASVPIFAQTKPETSQPQKAITERPLTESETTKAQLAFTQLLLLQKQFNVEEHQKQISDFQKAAQTPQLNNYAVVVEACKSVGVQEKDIQTQCGFTNGLDQTGKPMLDQNGKPVPPKVWKIQPAPSPEKK